MGTDYDYFTARGLHQTAPENLNAALSPDLHPVEVYSWYTEPDPDLFLGDEVDTCVSPLAWLRSGGSVMRLTMLARRL